MGMMQRIRAVVDPWGARAAWLNARLPDRNFDRASAKALTLSARGYTEGLRVGGIPRDRFGRVIGSFDSGPRTQLAQDAATLRREGKTLARFNPHARHAVRQIVNSVISNGINIKIAARTKKAQLAAGAAFTRSFEETNELDARRRRNFHQLSRFWMKTRLETGGVIMRLRPRFRSDDLAVPMSIQTLTYDYLYDGPAPRDLKAGETFANGIAFNQLTEESAFYLYKSHPDDTPGGRDLSNVTRVEKYDANGMQQVIHWFEPFQEDDHIGMPRGCIVYNTLTRKMDYDLSILDRKRIEAKRTNIWEADHSADPNDMPGRNTPTEWMDADGILHEGAPPSGAAPLEWQAAQDWANGAGEAVDNGEAVVAPPGYTYKPHLISNFQDHPAFSEGMLREIAVGFFAPEWLVTGDLRKLSFAGGELGLLYWQEDCKAECDDFISNVFWPIFRYWNATAERSNLWSAKDVSATARQNRPPKRDLLKDIKTLSTGIDALLIGREAAIMELGKDTIEEVNEQIERDIAWRRKVGITTEPGVKQSSAFGMETLASAIAEAMIEAQNLRETSAE